MKKKIELLIGLSLSVSLTFMSVGCASSKSAKTEIESQKASTTNSDTANNSIASNTETNNTTTETTSTETTSKETNATENIANDSNTANNVTTSSTESNSSNTADSTSTSNTETKNADTNNKTKDKTTTSNTSTTTSNNSTTASKAGTSNSVKNNTTTGNAGTKNTAQNNTTTGNTTSNNNTSKNTTSKNNSTSNSSTTAKNTTANNNTIVYTTQSAIIYKKIGGSAYHTLPRWEQVKKLGTSGNYTYIEWLDEKFYIETKYLTDTISQSPNRSKWIYTWDKLKNQLSKNTFGDKLYQRDGFFAYNPFYPKWRQNVSTEFDLFHIYRPDPEVVTVDWDFALSIDHFSDDKDYGSTKDFDETTKAIFEMIFPGKGLEFDAKLSDILNGKGKTYCKDITIKWIDNRDLTFGLPEVFTFEGRKISVWWSVNHPISIRFFPVNYDDNITKILYDADERLAHADLNILRKYFPDAK